MVFEIKRWLTWENTKKFIGVVLCLSVLVVVWRTTRLFYSPIVNSIEIQNGTFNYTSSSTELQTAISAGNLLSSIVVAGATIIYGVFTYFILDATNKNTKQSALSIQQNAKAQKIAHIEHQLEKFYMPMTDFLLRNKPKLIESHVNRFLVAWEFENSFKNNPDDIKKQDKDLYYYIAGLKTNFEKEYHSLASVSYLKTKDSTMYFFDIYKVIAEVYTKLLESFKGHKAGSPLFFADKCDNEKYEEMQATLVVEIVFLEKQLEDLLNL